MNLYKDDVHEKVANYEENLRRKMFGGGSLAGNK